MNKLLELDLNKEDIKIIRTLPKLTQSFSRKILKNTGNIQQELSKVVVDKTNNTIVPKIFNSNVKGTELDYIGVYIIGLAEILYQCFSFTEIETEAQKKLSKIYNKSINNFSQITKILNEYNNLSLGKSSFTQAMQIFLSMRTDMHNKYYAYFIRNTSHFMVLYQIDPQLFWRLFLETMEVGLICITDILNFDENDVKINRPHDRVLEYSTIDYTIPNKKSIRKITNCRSFCMCMTLQLYYNMLYHNGSSTNNSIIRHNNPNILVTIHDHAIQCLGNDDQSKVLKGIFKYDRITYDDNSIVIYDEDPILYFTLTDGTKVSRSLYEEFVLYTKAYNIDMPKNIYENRINMHYACEETIYCAFGEILYYSPADLLSKQIIGELEIFQKFKSKYDELEKISNNTNKLIAEANQKASQTISKERHEFEKEKAKLQQEIANLKAINASKTNIIEQLTSENKELNSIIANTYTDYSEIELEENVSLEKMIEVINEFKIALIGGRVELLDKLYEVGLTNIRQIGRNDFSTKWEAVKFSDFFIINSKFCSHTVTKKVNASIDDTNQIIYFNGTNHIKLIEACYDSIIRYLN